MRILGAVLDGVYRSGVDGEPLFLEVPAPTDEALRAVLHKIITNHVHVHPSGMPSSVPRLTGSIAWLSPLKNILSLQIRATHRTALGRLQGRMKDS